MPPAPSRHTAQNDRYVELSRPADVLVGQARSDEAFEGAAAVGHFPVEAPLRRAALGRAAVPLDARRRRGEDDRDSRLPTGRALLLRKRSKLRRHLSAVGISPPGLRVRRCRDRTGRVDLPSNPCGRVPQPILCRGEGAEGATSPESLRPKDRTGKATLESRSSQDDLTDGESRRVR